MSGSVLHVVRNLAPEMGGTSEAVPRLAGASAECDRSRNDLLDFGDGPPTSALVPAASQFRLPWHPLEMLLLAPARCAELAKKYSLIHIHGIWEPHCASFGRIARAQKKPYVVSAHGMLDPWAVRNKRFKKSLYAALLERWNLRRAACLRALTATESEDYRRFGYNGPVAIIPNGVNAPPTASAGPLFESFPQLTGRRIVLYLGRLHHKKGVHLLCRAWNRIAAAHPDAHLVIAGPDFENTESDLRSTITAAGLDASVTFAGMLTGDTKWSALKAAAVFILPSFSEGFSMAILEALAMGTPVIATQFCHFPELEQCGAGLLTEPDEDAIAATTISILDLPQTRREAMGLAGAELAARAYSWRSVGERMAALNSWLLHGSPTPSFVDAGACGR